MNLPAVSAQPKMATERKECDKKWGGNNLKIWKGDDFAWRYGDHGPKYICETKDFKFGLVYLNPGQNIGKHVHRIIEEVFYVMSGRADFHVNGEKYTVKTGQVVYVEPNDIHSVDNPYDSPAKIVLAASKTTMPDKITLE